MTPAQYHRVLVSLTSAETEFEHGMAQWTPDDRALYRAVRLLRSEILKRESGHPFPSLTSIALTATKFDEAPVFDSEDESDRPASQVTRLMIVDDDLAVRTVIRLFFENMPDIEVVAEAKNGLEAIEAAVRYRPSVVLMDLNMPLINGLEATRTILRLYPSSKMIIFTGNRDPRNLALAAEAGVVGYLSKPVGRDEVIAMVREAHAGGVRLGELRELSRME